MAGELDLSKSKDGKRSSLLLLMLKSETHFLHITQNGISAKKMYKVIQIQGEPNQKTSRCTVTYRPYTHPRALIRREMWLRAWLKHYPSRQGQRLGPKYTFPTSNHKLLVLRLLACSQWHSDIVQPLCRGCISIH
jgi:hypothetical protein